jgi:hypothetical protein
VQYLQNTAFFSSLLEAGNAKKIEGRKVREKGEMEFGFRKHQAFKSSSE